MQWTTVSVRILARSAAIVAITCLCPAKLDASDFRGLLLDANYAAPVRWNVGGSLLFSHDEVKNNGGANCIIVGGSLGRGGMQVWGGKALLGDFGGEGPGVRAAVDVDVRAVVARTWDDPLFAAANSTYVGGEVGVGFLLRLSVGYGKRISGPSTDHGHIVTWGVGVEIPWLR
jgi:hypothetical protein